MTPVPTIPPMVAVIDPVEPALLDAWLTHCQRHGVSRFHLALHFPDHAGVITRERVLAVLRRHRIAPGEVSAGPWHEDTNTVLRDAQRAAAGPGWHLIADSDEFRSSPAALPDLLAAAECSGTGTIGGLMLDHVSADGSLTACDWERGLDACYPLGGFVAHRLLRGDPRKIVAAHADVAVASGNHRAEGHRPANRPPVVVHHFKWRDGVTDDLEARVRNFTDGTWKSRSPAVAAEARRLLAHLDRHQGRISNSGKTPISAGARRGIGLTSPVILTWATTGRGGAVDVISETARHLRDYGTRVAVLWRTLDGAPPPAPIPGVHVQHRDDHPGYRRALEALLGQWPGAVVVSSHRTALADLPVCLPAGVPVACVLHGILSPGEPLRVLDRAGRCVLLAPGQLPWRQLRELDCWVGVTRASCASVEAACPDPVRVHCIYNGVGPGREPALRQGPWSFSAVGRAVRWRRWDVLLRAVAALPEQVRSQVTLDVIGEGPQLARLRRLAVDLGAPARFHGWRDDVPGWLAHTDVLVSAALLEGFGCGIAQAAAGGVPAVLPDTGSSRELVIPQVTGWLYRPGDPQSLTELLADIVAQGRETVWEMGARARTRAGALFTARRCAAQYVDLVHHLTHQKEISHAVPV